MAGKKTSSGNRGGEDISFKEARPLAIDTTLNKPHATVVFKKGPKKGPTIAVLS